jgi:adenosylhomocysteine nucleosidase
MTEISELTSIAKILKSKRIYILSALKFETLNSKEIIYSGVGKINATFAATNLINTLKPIQIINYGTAGSVNDKIVGLNECTNFIQHDIDASPLGFIKGQTPYDKINMISSKYNNGITCASGDSFIVNNREILADIVDMEAYAIAKVCKIMKIKFSCYKFITDNANVNKPENWKLNINRGVSQFINKLKLKYNL